MPGLLEEQLGGECGWSVVSKGGMGVDEDGAVDREDPLALSTVPNTVSAQ